MTVPFWILFPRTHLLPVECPCRPPKGRKPPSASSMAVHLATRVSSLYRPNTSCPPRPSTCALSPLAFAVPLVHLLLQVTPPMRGFGRAAHSSTDHTCARALLLCEGPLSTSQKNFPTYVHGHIRNQSPWLCRAT